MIASEKSYQNLSECNQSLFKKRLEVNKKQIFYSEKIRNSGNCIYDYAHSLMKLQIIDMKLQIDEQSIIAHCN